MKILTVLACATLVSCATTPPVKVLEPEVVVNKNTRAAYVPEVRTISDYSLNRDTERYRNWFQRHPWLTATIGSVLVTSFLLAADHEHDRKPDVGIGPNPCADPRACQ